jgi:hypothetical protein
LVADLVSILYVMDFGLFVDRIKASVSTCVADVGEVNVERAVSPVVGFEYLEAAIAIVREPVATLAVLPPAPDPVDPLVSVASGIPSPSVSGIAGVVGVPPPVGVLQVSPILHTESLFAALNAADPDDELRPPPPHAARARADVIKANVEYKRMFTTT